MEIIFKKGNSKNTITCRRRDGTATWMEADSFMITHDLTHYAVETRLKLNHGFYGLLAGGLDITDFEKKQKIKPHEIPAEGIRAEILVGLILTERNDGEEMKDFNQVYRESSEKFHLPVETLDANLLAKVRTGTDELLQKWRALPVGNSLVLDFPSP